MCLISNLSFCIPLTEGQDDRLRPLQGHEGQENGKKTYTDDNY